MKNIRLIGLLAGLLIGCNKSNDSSPVPSTQNPSTAREIISFTFAGLPAPWPATVPATITSGKIQIKLPPGLSPSALVPTIALSDSKATVDPNSGVAVDFTNPVTYTVTAESKDKSFYLTELLPPDATVVDVPTPPQYLCLYYGWPSYVNGLGIVGGDVIDAATFFSKFDVIVFGGGLQEPSHPDYQNTKAIIARLKQLKPGIKVFGYVTIRGTSQGGLNDTQLAAAVDAWRAMGITGIFGDEYDFSHDATRSRQNTFVSYVHSKNLAVFANGGNIEEVLGGSDCLLDKVHGDYYLMESFLYGWGQYWPLSEWKLKADRAYYYKKTKGVSIACVATTAASQATATSNTTDGYKMSWNAAFMYGFDAYQFTDKVYSAQSSQATVNFYPNPSGPFGTTWKQASYVNKVSGTRYERSTDTNTFYFTGDGATTGTGGH